MNQRAPLGYTIGVTIKYRWVRFKVMWCGVRRQA
jgi:hypothetical protein